MSRNAKSEIEILHSYDISLEDKTIYMGSHDYCEENGETGVDHQMVERIVKNLHVLDKKLHQNGITIKMNNIGGDVYHGMAIYDAIANCKNHVTIITYGHAMSMGSYIFQAGDTRIMAPTSRMMLHAIQDSVSGNYYKILEQLKETAHLQEIMNSVYLKRIREKKPKYSKNSLISKIKEDWFISPQEAIAIGLCDKIL